MTAHIDSGAPLPRELFDKMLAAKNFQSGLQTLRQIEFALFDMHLHYDFDPHGEKTVLQLLDEIRNQVAVVAFRGREPKIDALLRHNGMAA